MIEAAASENLKEALTEHLEVTKSQATRLELQQTLDEEKEANQKLTMLAGNINVHATAGATVASEDPDKRKSAA